MAIKSCDSFVYIMICIGGVLLCSAPGGMKESRAKLA